MSFEEQPIKIRQRVQQLAKEAISKDEPYCWFETLYKEAQGQAARVPWAKLEPHPYLVNWLSQSPQLSGLAVVIGCGLGDDAEALQAQGIEVTAFDISPSAIAWCQNRFPDSKVKYEVADLFKLDPTWQLRFDWVFECRNLQALPLLLRDQAISKIANLVALQGTLLMVTRLRDSRETNPNGPPWPLSNQELALFETLGLQEVYRQGFQEEAASIQRAFIEYRRFEVPESFIPSL